MMQSKKLRLRKDRGEKGGLLGATSLPGLILAHCKLLFKRGDDSLKPFNEWLEEVFINL